MHYNLCCACKVIQWTDKPNMNDKIEKETKQVNVGFFQVSIKANINYFVSIMQIIIIIKINIYRQEIEKLYLYGCRFQS